MKDQFEKKAHKKRLRKMAKLAIKRSGRHCNFKKKKQMVAVLKLVGEEIAKRHQKEKAKNE